MTLRRWGKDERDEEVAHKVAWAAVKQSIRRMGRDGLKK
jgi:cation transport regulator ChaB